MFPTLHSSTLSAFSLDLEVDTARPFRSVKEAVAVFGELFLAGEPSYQKTNSNVKLDQPMKPVQIYSSPSPKPPNSASASPPSYSSSVFNQDREDDLITLNSLKKLEAEVAGMRQELAVLKKRESEMELAVASLNAQLNKCLSKLAEFEAEKAAEISMQIEENPEKVRSYRWQEESKDMAANFEYLPSLAQALKINGEMRNEFNGTRMRKVQKKKPIIPLVGDIFSRKKSLSDRNSLYSQSSYIW
ncbi:uncharacterized protein [Typha latifolia]|uniref:uncharacterized protein n=1 Tax=Typha latifolia TaxID=4733 RepID=UPI003C30CAD8